MKRLQSVFLTIVLLMACHLAQAENPQTQRTPLLSNDKVSVWETIIYPANDILKMHRHGHDRVVIAFDNGTLEITNNKGQTHELKLEKGKAYYLPKDIPGETHTDKNIGNKPIKVIVIELNN